jgi:D-alanine-D-alanine ligase-like ATP-grasp enzyme
MSTSKSTCPDCGSAPTNHAVAWISVFLREYLSPFERYLFPKVTPEFMERMSAICMRGFQKLRLGKTTYEPTEKDNWRTRVLWEEAIKRGITLEEFHFLNIGEDLFFAEYKGKQRCFDGVPRPYGEASSGLEWMDNKPVMREQFAAAGIPIARGAVARDWKQAQEIFNSLEKPVIVKPKIGSRSRHTTTGILDSKTFHEACIRAWKLAPWVLIEEELAGPVFRATLVGKKVIAVMRRDPAAVIGDGIHTVRELAALENKRPERQGPLFHHVPEEGDEATEFLTKNGMTWDSIPQREQIVLLGMKTSRGVGGGTTDVTETVHPDNIELFEKVANLLDDSLVGIDFIMQDTSRSWKEQLKAGIIECNSMPFIDLHHYPLNGKAINVAGAVWDLVFPESKR